MTEDEARWQLAAATDLANSWARELGMKEAPTEAGLRDLIDRLWAECSMRILARDGVVTP